ncbi:MAG: DUF4438 domain-containing protein [Defluviitaleaceae bacterium]|nr:DUF4438 domain-containing protein [Defluviitaleaceae bacterium]MCL2262140.1 DUF4438 domain-containing protein [Defluviitaleaceae bacterium]
MRTNSDKLPIVSVSGAVWHPKGGAAGRITSDGNVVWLTGTGGITYNAKIGDPCIGWAADHLEPGVTARNKDEEYNQAFTILSCVGNEARIRSGDAKGETGFVTGKHGGCEHLLIHFPQDTLEKLNIGDTISIKATGQGLELLDYPEIKTRNVSPSLLEKLNIIEESNNRIKVGVSKIIPAKIMGSGLGHVSTARGDYDITMFDDETVAKYDLATLRFGDIVAITDADNRFGRSYRKGACTIGIIVHGNSFIAGHGPGVTTLLTSKEPLIEPFTDSNANLANMYLQ